MNLKQIVRKISHSNTIKTQLKEYYLKFNQYSYVDLQCVSQEQFKASITRLYHTIEKGLSYKEYKPGFGKENIEKLIQSLEQYVIKGFDCSAEFYETALSCLELYIIKNKEYGLIDKDLEGRVARLPGDSNGLGGVIEIKAPISTRKMNFEQLISSRHSIRHFSQKTVDLESLRKAIRLAQYTPSACNRQGWKARIINDRETITTILENQNGNRGFGNEIDKLIIITADLRFQQKNRELFQAYIDGGMYAANILNALYYYGIGSVPLSAALTPNQESAIRAKVNIDDAEVFILIVGIGNYPDEMILTTRSERRFQTVEIV